MKKLIGVFGVVAASAIVAACSQGDAHPPFISDCTTCGQPVGSTGGDGGATDGSKTDGSTTDSSAQDATGNDASTNDAGNGDGAATDGASLDTGTDA